MEVTMGEFIHSLVFADDTTMKHCSIYARTLDEEFMNWGRKSKLNKASLWSLAI